MIDGPCAKKKGDCQKPSTFFSSEMVWVRFSEKSKLRGPRVRLRVIIACCLLAAALAADAGRAAALRSTTMQEVSEGLTCQCGCGLTIANCNHPNCGFAVPLRVELQALIDKGMGGSQILAGLRHKYGEKILSAPTVEGFNILAWAMPFIAIVAGGALIIAAIGRWRQQAAPAHVEPGPAGDEFDAALRRRLERELRTRL